MLSKTLDIILNQVSALQDSFFQRRVHLFGVRPSNGLKFVKLEICKRLISGGAGRADKAEQHVGPVGQQLARVGRGARGVESVVELSQFDVAVTDNLGLGLVYAGTLASGITLLAVSLAATPLSGWWNWGLRKALRRWP